MRKVSAARDWAVAVCVAGMLLVAGGLSGPERTDLRLPGLALLGAAGLVLAARRRAPVSVLVATGVCALGYRMLGFDLPPLAFLFAVYAATRAGHRMPMLVMTAILVAAQPLTAVVSPGGPSACVALAQGVLGLGWVLACGVAGEALRQAEGRAEEAERTREETARRRAGEERLRIAREREIVILVARGLSNQEIAERLVISPLTAKTHVNRAMTKLHARDRAQLVIFAYQTGLAGTSRP
jgi:DNA-binding CsgD family transcriptional regulator